MKKNEAKQATFIKSDKNIASNKYNPNEIELKWQSKWQKDKNYQINLDSAKNPFYNLMMFPYPSAEGLHIGGVRTFVGVDIYSRFKRMKGKNVFMPFGLDGFGIHAENYALKIGENPMTHAEVTEKNYYRQIKESAISVDWSRTVETYKSDYYKWTQWLFTELFKAGLAYRKKSPVNYCPSCKTVLADEQVIDGKCERCSSVVEKRDLEQWYFAITKYADQLLNNIDKLNWTEKVKIAQKNWIGKKEGVQIKHKVVDMNLEFETFSAYPAWSWADSFIVIAPEHPLVGELVKGTKQEQAVLDFIKESKDISNKDRIEDKFEKKGVFTNRYAKDPFGGPDMPIWLANFALMDFGTGIIRCSGHDPRDVEFAAKYGIKTKEVVDRIDPNEPINAHTNKGILKDSGPFTGRDVGDVIEETKDWMEKEGVGRRVNTYHLRDWLISRQRYWGPPIPMVYCESCAKNGFSWFDTEEAKQQQVSIIKYKVFSKDEKILNTKYKIPNTGMAGWFPVEQKDLPVELPYIEDFKPLGTGVSPLGTHPEFYQVACPECKKPARRETDVSDTFLDSSWYFLRYLATDWEDVPFPSAKLARIKNQELRSKDAIGNWKLDLPAGKAGIGNSTRRVEWLPVDMYIGGAEHSVLHLLYARFITMFLKDQGYISFDEPFSRFYAHGMIIKEGAKMSKSKGNVVGPDIYIKKYGADTFRMYLHFLSPFDQSGDFRDEGIEGMYRFLKKLFKLFSEAQISNFQFPISNDGLRMMNKTIKGITEDMENLRYNTAIAKLMEYYNFLAKQAEISAEEIEVYLKLLAPFAPHMTEELYQHIFIGNDQWKSIHASDWPKYDEKYLVQDLIIIPIQVNGKLRATLEVSSEDAKNQAKIEELAIKDEKMIKFLEGKSIKKVIYIPGKVVNIVV